MENNKIIIILLVIIIILLAGILAAVPNFIKKDDVEVSDERVAQEITNNSDVPDSIIVELPEFDRKFTKQVGEYTVEAKKWKGGSVGGFGVWLYKNGELVNKDSYLSRAYFYMDGEWKWSDWGNGQGANYHKYPVSSGVEIQKIEVKFQIHYFAAAPKDSL